MPGDPPERTPPRGARAGRACAGGHADRCHREAWSDVACWRSRWSRGCRRFN